MIIERASFLAPRPHQPRKPGCPGTQIEFALQMKASSSPLHEVFFPQEMFPNVYQTQTFAGGNFWRDITFAHLFKRHKSASPSKRLQDAKCRL